jgi:hypothetical protein
MQMRIKVNRNRHNIVPCEAIIKYTKLGGEK